MHLYAGDLTTPEEYEYYKEILKETQSHGSTQLLGKVLHAVRSTIPLLPTSIISQWSRLRQIMKIAIPATSTTCPLIIELRVLRSKQKHLGHEDLVNGFSAGFDLRLGYFASALGFNDTGYLSIIYNDEGYVSDRSFQSKFRHARHSKWQYMKRVIDITEQKPEYCFWSNRLSGALICVCTKRQYDDLRWLCNRSHNPHRRWSHLNVSSK